MLSTIRENTKGWIAGIILGLIAIPFALWGINYYFEGGSVKVAVVNGVDIGVDAYRRTLDDQRRSFQQMLGQRFDSRIFDSPDFRNRVLDAMIDEILMTEAVKSEGYRISSVELARQIRQAPQFQREGQFDPKLYEFMLRNAGLDARSFEAKLRNDVLMRHVESGYTQSAIVSTADMQSLMRLQAQEREAVIAVLKPARLQSQVKVTPEAIEQEYSQNAGRYKTTERVRIQYLRLSAADLSKDIRVSPDEIQQALADAAQTTTAQEERRASHILIKLDPAADPAAEKAAMSKIRDLRAKLLAGGDFATLAKAHSEDPGSARQGGDLGQIARGSMAKEFEQALFALKKPGSLSEPIRTQYGLHLIKLTGLKSAPNAPTVNRAKIEADLRARKAEQRFFDLSERFHNLVYENPDSLKPAADTLGLKLETSDWFTRAGGGNGVAANRKLVEAAFDSEVLDQARNSQAIETAPGTLVALRILAHEPARQRPLSEVRAGIEKTLLQAALQNRAMEIGQEAVKKLQQGGTFESVARGYGMDVNPSRRYKRDMKDADRLLVQALFRTAHPDQGKPSYDAAASSDGSMALIMLKRVVEPDTVSVSGNEAGNIRRSLEARRGRDYFEYYRANLRNQASVKIYKDQL